MIKFLNEPDNGGTREEMTITVERDPKDGFVAIIVKGGYSNEQKIGLTNIEATALYQELGKLIGYPHV